MGPEQEATEADRNFRAYSRDWMFTQWLVTALRLAAEREPEEFREFLASIFPDAKGYQEELERLRASYQRAQVVFQELHGRIGVLEKQLKEAEDSLGAVHHKRDRR